MKNRNKLIPALLLALSMAFSCQKPEPLPPAETKVPRLLSSSPENGAEDVMYGSIDMVLNFDCNVICPTARRPEMSIENGASISGVEAGSRTVTLSLKGLKPSAEYCVTLPEGTVTGYKDNPAESIVLSFKTREPASHSISESPVNPDASANTRRLYSYLLSIYGQKSLSGAIAKVNWNTDEAEWVAKWTGKWPAMATFDYIHLFASPANWIDYSDISPVRDWFGRGGIVSACWHWNVPLSEGSTEYSCTPGDGTGGTCFRPSNIFKEGTWEKRTADADLAKIAGYLKLIQAEDIPVIWRPLHEAAGNTYTQYHSGAWFWWGVDGAETYVQLWRYMYDYFKKEGLNNLIWVWTSQTSCAEDLDSPFYPGDGYVDIIGKDIYNQSSASAISDNFKLLGELYPAKMLALSEHGNVPSMAEQWKAGAGWLYFMPWYDYSNDYSENYAHQHADIAWWKASFSDEAILSLDELPEKLYE